VLDVFVRDLQRNTTTLVSRAAGASGVKGNDASLEPAISGDARFVAFRSLARNLRPEDSDMVEDIYRRELGNNEPSAGADAYTAAQDTPLTVETPGVLANDSDPDGDPITETLVGSGPAHGTLALNANGSFTYTPASGYSGPDTFTYRATDGSLDSAPASVSITVSAAPAPPPPGPPAPLPAASPAPPAVTVKPICQGLQATIIGTAGRDVLRGTPAADVIVALGGNDVVRGLGGNDRVCAGAGNDRVDGGAGADRLAGAAGKDLLLGGPGQDLLLGGAGVDTLRGGPGKDRINGGAGRDRSSQ
jgi:Ca2+-binding RTX toxin-like protein